MSIPGDPASPEIPSGSLDPRLRGWLVCPSCRGELTEIPGGLRCEGEGTRYPIHGGVPWLHPDFVVRDPPGDG